ncbi:MAG: hypothetical protein ACFFC5_02420 [Promethearchaeota archaeon]
MGSSERNYDLSNLLLVVGGGLMLLFNLSAIAWSGVLECPEDPFLGYGDYGVCMNLMVAFVAIESLASMMGILVIVLTFMWNKDHNYLFAFIVYVLAGLNSMFGVFHAISSYYGLGFGIPIVLSGLLVLLGGALKYNRLMKVLALGAHISISDEQERSEEMQA